MEIPLAEKEIQQIEIDFINHPNPPNTSHENTERRNSRA
jgi:hypothetical protein